jgi:hypothetical protein
MHPPVPVGVADKLYAVARACEELGALLLDGGQVEASPAVVTTSAFADQYSECLLDTDYQCGRLRMQYIQAVNEMAGCKVADSIFDLAIGRECQAVLQASLDPD